MKKLFIILITSIFVTSSCNVLDQEPTAQQASDSVFKDEESVQFAMNGLYNLVQSIYNWRLQLLVNLGNDVLQNVDTYDAFNGIDDLKFTSDNTSLEDYYAILYRVVDDANQIIQNVSALDFAEEETKNDYLGQAHAIRGLAFLELTRLWGGFPGDKGYGEKGIVLRLENASGTEPQARSTLVESYNQIKKDLEKAETLVVSSREGIEDKIFINKATVRALLARVALYTEDYEGAISRATEVIADSRFDLSTPYGEIFAGGSTSESIFEILFTPTDNHGWKALTFTGRGSMLFHEEAYNDLISRTSDVRVNEIIESEKNEGKYAPNKYKALDGSDNLHVIRTAEMYLIRAEAYGFTGKLTEGLDDLNAVRERAGLLALSSVADSEQLLDAILDERKVEFFAEGHRWFDLVRTGRAMTTLNKLKSSRHTSEISLKNEANQLFPLPSATINAGNGLVEQNSAY